MKKYTCIIVDDSEIDRLSLLACLKNYPQFEVLGIFQSAEEALLNKKKVDILFCDIQMPGLNGLQFRKKMENIPICIFISYSPKYAVETYELETLDYIVKPLTNERFSKTTKKIEDFFELREKALLLENMERYDTIFLKEGNDKIKINTLEIQYLEALRDYTKLVTKNNDYRILSSFSSFLKQQQFSNFVRVHRSFAVQKRFVTKIKSNQIVLQDNTKIPIGRTYKNNLQLLLE